MTLVSLAIADDLAVITLDNPPVNALSTQMIADFHAAFDELSASSARAVVTRSNTPVFSAGADVRVFLDKDFTQARRSDGSRLAEKLPALPSELRM